MKFLAPTFILLLIVAAVGGYIYFNERGPMSETGAAVLLRLEPSNVSTVELTQADGQKVVLQKDGANWQVQRTGKNATPLVAADAESVKSLLQDVQLVQSTAVMPDDAAKLKEFGLDKPQSRLTIGKDTITFGHKPSFDATKIYAHAGSQIAVLPATLNDAINKPFDAWRDKMMLRIDLAAIRSVTIKAPAIAANFVKVEPASTDAAPTWNITQPITGLADKTPIEALINQLATTKTTKFLDDQPKSPALWGLDKPLSTLTIGTSNGEQILRIGKKLKDGYAAQNGVASSVFQITDATYALINRPLYQWRSKTVAKLEIANLTNLEVTARNSVRHLTKQGDKWISPDKVTTSSPTAMPRVDIDNQSALDLIINLQNLSAENFIDKSASLATYGFDKPILQAKLTATTAPTLTIIQIGKQGGKLYARVGNGTTFNPPVYVLPTNALNIFQNTLDGLFPR